MKLIYKLFLLSMLIPVSAFASNKWYFGLGLGDSHLNFDAPSYVNNYIVQNGYQNDDNILNAIGAPLFITSKIDSGSKKVFLGRILSKHWNVEASYQDYGSFSASVSEGKSISFNPSANINWTILSAEHITGYIKGNGTVYENASITANSSVTSYGLAFVFNTARGQEFNTLFMLGVHKVDATYSLTTTYNYGYNGSYTASATCTGPVGCSGSASGSASNNVSYNKTTHGYDTAVVPVLGVGEEYKLGPSNFLRVDFERIGDPRNGGYHIDNYNISIVQYF